MTDQGQLPPDTAAASMLLMARQHAAGYRYNSDQQAMRAATIGLFRSLVRAGELDLKSLVAEDPLTPHLPLPAAWTLIENPHVDRVSAWAELDAACLAVETTAGPSFKIAVEQSMARLGAGHGDMEIPAEDLALAEWARHVPAQHCCCFDEPGDHQAAGLLRKLRATGHYVHLEDELARKGFDLDGKLADGTPSAIEIHAPRQWDSWLAAGGNPFALVPAHKGTPAMALWEYQGLKRPGQLLPAIRAWAETIQPPPPGFMDRLEHLEFWHKMDVLSGPRSTSRDAFVEELKAIPDWTTRTDDAGRNVLQRVLANLPAFLTTCMNQKRLNSQVLHVDAAGRDIWYYATSALLSYNRHSDAKKMGDALRKFVNPTAKSFDGHRGRGLLIKALLQHAASPPEAEKPGTQTRTGRQIPDYSSLKLPLEVLLAGSAPQQDAAAVHLLSMIGDKEHMLSGIVHEVVEQVAKSLSITPRWRAASEELSLTPSLRAVLVYSLLCHGKAPYDNRHGPSLVSKEMLPWLNDWLADGACLPALPGQCDPFHRVEDLADQWKSFKVSTQSSQMDVRPQLPDLFKHWLTYEQAASMDRHTAQAPKPMVTRPAPRL